ncbi:MAG: hypothetical protein ACE5DY_00485 [Mariprofundaceae bacterium]
MAKFYPSRTILLGLVLSGILWAAPSYANEEKLESYDADGDGKITFDEVMRHIEPSIRLSFDAMDRNKDGVLSDKDFDDVREGVKKWEGWLNHLLEPFLAPDKPERNEVQHF